MKKILFFLLFASLFTGCGKDPKPDDLIQKTEEIPDGFKPGPTRYDDPVPVVKTMVTISPTWGQANYFASKRGDFQIWQIIGAVLLILAVYTLIGYYSLLDWKIFKAFPNISAMAFGAFMFVFLAGSLVSFKWQSAAIKWNNDVKIEKGRYDQALEEAGSTRPIWDSLEKNNRLRWGPYNLYK